MRFFLMGCLLFFLSAPMVWAGEAPPIQAAGAILIERESGRVLFEQNADQRLPMASTTKIMTALLTLEHCALDETVTAGKNASGVPGTSIYLGEGEQLSVEHMLQGLLLRSGNDAAVALAEHVAGNVQAFAAMMNQRARELGADAFFVTPNGLDAPGHSASARAMALIANEAMDFPAFQQLVSMKRAVIPWRDSQYDRVLTNKNKLLSTYDGATGVKTGFTNKAGRCLVFSAQRNGMELLGVVLNCPNWFGAAADLMDWGFENYAMKECLESGQIVAQMQIEKGMERYVNLVSPVRFRLPVKEGETITIKARCVASSPAPIQAGMPLGQALIMVNGKPAVCRTLVAEETVEKRTFFTALKKIFYRFNPAA